MDKIMDRVEQGPDCWRWNGYHHQGIGNRPTVGYPPELVYRAVWKILRGPIDSDTHLHHRCGHPWCVNPDHLEPISVVDHAKLHAIRPTHCHRGHEYTPENSIFNTKGHRRCRQCVSDQRRLKYAKGVGKTLDELRPMKRRKNLKMYTPPWEAP